VTAEGFVPAPRLIALSGYGMPNDLQRAREAGFARHLLKPADPDALFALIEEAEVSG
jgi:CheY-like chemotaxis protein